MQRTIAEYTIDTSNISDEASAHDTFARTFLFPPYYGRNWDAWIDCVSDDAIIPGDSLIILRILQTEAFQQRCPQVLDRFILCTAFVNNRFNMPRVALLFT